MSNQLSDATGGTVGENTPSEAVETTPEATTGQTTETETSEIADDAGEATEETPKKVPWFQKRIDEVTARKYEAEREAAYWRGIAEGKTPQAPLQQEQTAPPDRWEDPEGHDRWLIEQATKAARDDFAKQQNARTYDQRISAFRESKPDFDRVALNPSLPVTKDMAQVIFESDKGPEVLYHLGSNPAEADRIARLPAYLQAKELGKIEASLGGNAATPQPKRNPPPPPPNTVAGMSSGIQKDPGAMSMSEYVAWMKTRG